MTRFNPENKEKLTYGETLHPAMTITDEEDAKQYYNSYVEYMMNIVRNDNPDLSDSAIRTRAEELCKANLGYFCGYYDNEIRLRVERLFFNIKT